MSKLVLTLPTPFSDSGDFDFSSQIFNCQGTNQASKGNSFHIQNFVFSASRKVHNEEA